MVLCIILWNDNYFSLRCLMCNSESSNHFNLLFNKKIWNQQERGFCLWYFTLSEVLPGIFIIIPLAMSFCCCVISIVLGEEGSVSTILQRKNWSACISCVCVTHKLLVLSIPAQFIANIHVISLNTFQPVWTEGDCQGAEWNYTVFFGSEQEE